MVRCEHSGLRDTASMVKLAGGHSLPWLRGQHSLPQRAAWSSCRRCPASVLCLPKTPQVSYARESDAPYHVVRFGLWVSSNARFS